MTSKEKSVLLAKLNDGRIEHPEKMSYKKWKRAIDEAEADGDATKVRYLMNHKPFRLEKFYKDRESVKNKRLYVINNSAYDIISFIEANLDSYNMFFLTRRHLAEKLGMSEKTVKETIKKMKEAQLIIEDRHINGLFMYDPSYCYGDSEREEYLQAVFQELLSQNELSEDGHDADISEAFDAIDKKEADNLKKQIKQREKKAVNLMNKRYTFRGLTVLQEIARLNKKEKKEKQHA